MKCAFTEEEGQKVGRDIYGLFFRIKWFQVIAAVKCCVTLGRERSNKEVNGSLLRLYADRPASLYDLSDAAGSGNKPTTAKSKATMAKPRSISELDKAEPVMPARTESKASLLNMDIQLPPQLLPQSQSTTDYNKEESPVGEIERTFYAFPFTRKRIAVAMGPNQMKLGWILLEVMTEAESKHVTRQIEIYPQPAKHLDV